MTMSEQVQRRKGKKSYAELLAELDDIFSKTANVAIGQLCEAAKEEHPDWDNKKIQNQVTADVRKWWEPGTVYNNLPSWIHDQAEIRAKKKMWETRNKNERNSLNKKFNDLAKQEFRPLKLPDEQSTKYEDMEDEDLGVSELNEYGDTGESAAALYAKINGPARELFKALTQKEMPHLVDDVVADFLKPSREYRTGIFHEVDRNMQVSLYNALVWTRDAIDDTLNILDKITKQEKK